MFCPLFSRGYKWTRPATEAKTGSMRQILNMPSTPEYRNASTCSFSAQKGRCAHRFRNLPHTSGEWFRKCGKNRNRPTRPLFYASANSGFVGKNQVVLEVFDFSPHFRNMRPCKACSNNISGIRDNIKLSRKRQRAVAGNRTTTPLCHRLT